VNRRGFLTRSGLALGALLVGDEVLEAMDRLTHQRKSFPSADIHAQEGVRGLTTITDDEISGILREVYTKFRMQTQHLVTPLLSEIKHGQKYSGRTVYYDVVHPRA
jgi:hypothetical protein